MLFISFTVNSQVELKCGVNVNYQKIQGTNKEIFRSMQKDIHEFMNLTKWTDHHYAHNEKIECKILITLSEQQGSDAFIGTIQVSSERPIYNSSYKTRIFNYKERSNDFHFTYQEGQPLEFDESSFTSNLTSVLAFYAYVIIGLDYDTFSLEGGNQYFQKAFTICDNAKSSNRAAGPGWQAFESRTNRYWLIENLTNEVYKPIRRCMYRYHRLGLDVMSDKLETGRAEIASSVSLLRDVHLKKPGSYIMTIFFDAKKEELINIFKSSFAMEREKVYKVLSSIDPSNTSDYDAIMKGNNDKK